jgi:hypothetical protein
MCLSVSSLSTSEHASLSVSLSLYGSLRFMLLSLGVCASLSLSLCETDKWSGQVIDVTAALEERIRGPLPDINSEGTAPERLPAPTAVPAHMHRTPMCVCISLHARICVTVSVCGILVCLSVCLCGMQTRLRRFWRCVRRTASPWRLPIRHRACLTRWLATGSNPFACSRPSCATIRSPSARWPSSTRPPYVASCPTYMHIQWHTCTLSAQAHHQYCVTHPEDCPHAHSHAHQP